MKNNLKKKPKQNYHNLPRDCAGPASIIPMLTQKSSQLSQRYKYAMLTNSACSIAITFFLVLNYWKVEGYQPKRKFSLAIKVCLFLFVCPVSVCFFSSGNDDERFQTTQLD